jgi:hypothetical protein
LYSKPVYKKRRKTISKQTPKYLEYLNNKFINKDGESRSDTLLTLLAYSSILSLLSLKKRSYKREQPTRVSKGRLRQATKDGRGGLAT